MNLAGSYLQLARHKSTQWTEEIQLEMKEVKSQAFRFTRKKTQST